MTTPRLTGLLADPSQLIERIRGAVDVIVSDTTGQIASDARAAAPVLTGRLRDGLIDRAEPGPPDQIRRSVGVVGPAGSYARFVISSKVGQRAAREPMAAAIVAAAIQEVENG
jgi:hypothetical protein